MIIYKKNTFFSIMDCLLYRIRDIFLGLVATFWTTYVSFDLGPYIRKVDVGVDSFLYPYFNKYMTFSIVFKILFFWVLLVFK